MCRSRGEDHRASPCRLSDPLALVTNWAMHNRVRHMHGPWKDMRFRSYYDQRQIAAVGLPAD